MSHTFKYLVILLKRVSEYITINKKIGEFDILDKRFYAVDCCCSCCCCVFASSIPALAAYAVTDSVLEKKEPPSPRAGGIKMAAAILGAFLGMIFLGFLELWYWGQVVGKDIILFAACFLISAGLIIIYAFYHHKRTGNKLKYSIIALFTLLGTIMLNLILSRLAGAAINLTRIVNHVFGVSL